MPVDRNDEADFERRTGYHLWMAVRTFLQSHNASSKEEFMHALTKAYAPCQEAVARVDDIRTFFTLAGFRLFPT